jgi:hypothetical protein
MIWVTNFDNRTFCDDHQRQAVLECEIATAPPSSVMNSRRFTSLNRIDCL